MDSDEIERERQRANEQSYRLGDWMHRQLKRHGVGTIIDLPRPQDVWQFSVDVYRRPDGQMAARLSDARTSLIESGDKAPHEKMREIADMLEQSIGPMRADAEALRE